MRVSIILFGCFLSSFSGANVWLSEEATAREPSKKSQPSLLVMSQLLAAFQADLTDEDCASVPKLTAYLKALPKRLVRRL
jgi:hypothetical protein